VKETSVNVRTSSLLLMKSVWDSRGIVAVEGVRIDYGDEDKD
jgi:hypothetical protein